MFEHQMLYYKLFSAGYDRIQFLAYRDHTFNFLFIFRCITRYINIPFFDICFLTFLFKKCSCLHLSEIRYVMKVKQPKFSKKKQNNSDNNVRLVVP